MICNLFYYFISLKVLQWKTFIFNIFDLDIEKLENKLKSIKILDIACGYFI